MAEGSVRAGEPGAMAVFVWSSVHGFATLFSGAPDGPDVDVLLEQMYLGLRPLDGDALRTEPGRQAVSVCDLPEGSGRTP